MADTELKEKKGISLNKYYAYIGPFIIFLGMTRLIFFYKSFGITITNYLEFSEIITSFFDILVILAFFLSFALLQNYLLYSKAKTNESIGIRKKIIEEKNFWRILSLYFSYLKSLILLYLATFGISIISHYFYVPITDYEIKLASSLFLFLIIIIIVSVEIERKHKILQSNQKTRMFYTYVLYCFIVIFTIIGYSTYQINSIRNSKTTFGVTIVLENDQIIKSDSSYYYIGKTQNFVFIHNQTNNFTDVIPVNRIKKLVFPNQIKKD